MADLIAYTDLATYLNVTFSAPEQTVASQCCSAASDAIRTATSRSFEIQGAASDRYFTANRPYGSNLINLAYWYPWPAVYPSLFAAVVPTPKLVVDDYFLVNQTLTNITVTDTISGTTYTPTSAWPFNAAAQGYPCTQLTFAPGTFLPLGEGQLKVNAIWGWPALPLTIVNAALIQASRYFKRKDAPFGVAGWDGGGNAMRLLARLDPDVELMCSAARRWWAAG